MVLIFNEIKIDRKTKKPSFITRLNEDNFSFTALVHDCINNLSCVATSLLRMRLLHMVAFS